MIMRNTALAALAALAALVWGGWGPAASSPAPPAPPRKHEHVYARRSTSQQKTCFMPRPRSNEPGQASRTCYQEQCACGEKRGGLICGDWSPCEPLRPTR